MNVKELIHLCNIWMVKLMPDSYFLSKRCPKISALSCCGDIILPPVQYLHYVIENCTSCKSIIVTYVSGRSSLHKNIINIMKFAYRHSTLAKVGNFEDLIQFLICWSNSYIRSNYRFLYSTSYRGLVWGMQKVESHCCMMKSIKFGRFCCYKVLILINFGSFSQGFQHLHGLIGLSNP